jgi:hypothetical protein
VTFPEASGIIAHVYRPQFPAAAFWAHASTVRGQLAGLAMITLPALTDPLPLGRGLHVTVQLLAVMVGVVGAVIVFGGLVNRVFIAPTGRPLDDVLPTLPFARRVWLAMVLLTILLAVIAEWRFVLIFTDSWIEHLPEFVLLGLPAGLLGWATWRARTMRAGDQPAGRDEDEPVRPA